MERRGRALRHVRKPTVARGDGGPVPRDDLEYAAFRLAINGAGPAITCWSGEEAEAIVEVAIVAGMGG